jgi:hypothetical protein
MMADFVRYHVRLGEFTGSAEAGGQLIEETQVDVYLFVFGAVKRAGCRLRRAASGLGVIAEQHQLGMAVIGAGQRQQAGPRLLHIVQDEGDELDFAITTSPGIAVSGVSVRRRGRSAAAGEQGKQIHFEDETQNDQQQRAADPQVNAAEAASAEAKSAAAAFVFAAPVFDIGASPPGCPFA